MTPRTVGREGIRHEGDYRFPGNRYKVKWAAVGENGEVGMMVLESGTGNVSFENIAGRIYLTENIAVAGYGGKASAPGSLKSPQEINMKALSRSTPPNKTPFRRTSCLTSLTRSITGFSIALPPSTTGLPTSALTWALALFFDSRRA